MRRALALTLTVLQILCFAACRNVTKTDPPAPSGATSSTAQPSRPDHLSLTCRAASAITWKTVRVCDPSVRMDLRLEIPQDWTLQKADNETYTVLRAGTAIGYMTIGDLPESEELLDSSLAEGDLDASYQVHWYREDGVDTVRRTLRFVNMQRGKLAYRLFFNLLYTELDDVATKRLVESVQKIPNTSFVHPDQGNGSKQILILGNSFVSDSYSQIGVLVNKMLSAGSTGYTATMICKGGQGLQAFANDPYLLGRIEQGEFCYVFQCGFYASETALLLDVIEDVCDRSNTKLVIFPAHNEQPNPIKKARLLHDRVYFLDWKTEIQTFIDNGLDRSLLCYDDSYQHSTRLAGYIGAHMIYRSLFGTVPPDLPIDAPLEMAYVRNALGDQYVDTLPSKTVYAEEYTF